MTSNPYREDDFGRASEYMRLALALLGKYKIPPTPFNYRIGYEYVAGNNPPLKQSFDQLSEQAEGFSAEALLEMYHQYVAEDERAFEKLRQELKSIILDVQSEFQNSGGNLSNYARTLSQFADILEAPTAPKVMSSEVQKVLSDTQSMRESQRQMESNMSQIMAEMGSLRKELEQVREDSLLDALTGISNRKAFDSGLETTISESREQGSVFCLLLIDIDHFKQFNDTHGHLVGDKVLRFVAATLKRCIKGKDLCARYGGEEFAIILPDTDLAGAHTIAEQIRVAISGRVLKDSASGQAYGRITVSIGAGQYCDGELPNDTIGRADQALYQAKARGRNRVVVAES